MAGQPWRPVSASAYWAATAGVALVCWLANTGERWVFLLDSANLALHEAGHPFFGLVFGERMTVYGGTLGQLVFPLATAGSFWWRRETLSFALAVAWLFENFWNIARYMADARSQVLPLVGSGEHDWTEIFLRWGALPSDTRVAAFVSVLAWIGILGLWAWFTWRATRGWSVLSRSSSCNPASRKTRNECAAFGGRRAQLPASITRTS